jgi:hypothetical protein
VASKKRGGVLEVEDAPYEAYAPTAIRVGGGIASQASAHSLEGLENLPGTIVHGCDGEDMYVWWVRPNKKGTGLRVTEVSPGLDKKNTRLRKVTDASDLTYSENKKTLEQLIARWTKALVGDLMPENKTEAKSKKAKNKASDKEVEPEEYEERVGTSYEDDDSDVEEEDDGYDGDDW